MSLISGLAVGRSRRLSGLRREGRGRMPRVLASEGRTVVVGKGGCLRFVVEGGESGGVWGDVGEETRRWREKFRMLDAEENLEKRSGERDGAMEVRLLLRAVLGVCGVRAVASVVEMLLLRKLLRPDVADPADEELVSVPLLLILRNLLKAPRLLRGGLVEEAQIVI